MQSSEDPITSNDRFAPWNLKDIFIDAQAEESPNKIDAGPIWALLVCNFDICNEIQQAVATPYSSGKIFEPPFWLKMTNLSHFFAK